MKTTTCELCNHSISNCNFKSHRAVCDGSGPYAPLVLCKWCGIFFDKEINISNHVRWCKENPSRDLYNKDISHLSTPDAVAKRIEAIKRAHADGKYKAAHISATGKPGKLHTPESKELMRRKALASPHRRLRKSVRDYIKKDGTIVKLDSSWEEALAVRLDEINIEWIRPLPIKWIDENNIGHNYFPDFYLPNYDVYLDPKNPYAIKSQQKKLSLLTAQLKNLIIITSLEDCKIFTPPFL